MKRIFILVLTGGMIIAGCASRVPSVPTLQDRMMITDAALEAHLGLKELAEALSGYDAVFIGEVHDDSLTHVVEMDLLRRLHARHANLAVALEMFERDVQSVLDDYLAGRIPEETFLERSRPWKNYATDYRPLVEYAKDHGLPVLAMNVPRRYAGRLAMQGASAFEAIPDSEKVWVARHLKPLSDEYKVRFLAFMNESMPGPMARMLPENLYLGQVLKDDTMAESIADFVKTHPKTRIVSYQGDFHSAFGLGIVQKVRLLNPDLRCVVVSVVPASDDGPRSGHRDRGDFILFLE